MEKTQGKCFAESHSLELKVKSLCQAGLGAMTEYATLTKGFDPTAPIISKNRKRS